ncbi:MAG TPA: hypothetical protein VFJ12_03010 [Segeticoccus sp.]|nr:hypothetical protein [Segeticoccus sp.]
MSESEGRQSLLLPPGTRLLHIGPPKTGTSTLQSAARSSRKELYAAGVHYPGHRKNHRREFCALMGRADPLIGLSSGRSTPRGATRAQATGVPPMAEWTSLLADIESEASKRILLSHESAATAPTSLARKFIRQLGPDRVHVAITLRPPSAVLPSRWIERLKGGASDTFEEWLARVYGEAGKPISDSLRRTLDQGELVERWAEVAGPENVTVVVLDGTDKNLLTDTFEQLLGVPERTLTGAVTGGKATNRSMSLPEADVFRQLNATLRETRGVSWPLYLDVVRGAMNHVLERRTPLDGEPRVRMPRWAAELAVREGQQHADRIARTGVRVVGSLDALSSRPEVAEDLPPDGGTCPRSLAVEALSGAVRGAVRAEQTAAGQAEQAEAPRTRVPGPERRTIKQQVAGLPEDARARSASAAYPTRDLVRALGLSLRRGVRRRVPGSRR